MRDPVPYAHAIESLKTCLYENEYPELKIRGILVLLDLHGSLVKVFRALHGQSHEIIAELVALAVFMDLVRSRIVPLVYRNRLRSRNAFVRDGVDLNIRPDLVVALYQTLAVRWHKARSSSPRPSTFSRYLSLQSNGSSPNSKITSELGVSILQKMGRSIKDDRQMQSQACRSNAFSPLHEVVTSEEEADRHDCCLSFDGRRWWERSHFEGKDSRLLEVVKELEFALSRVEANLTPAPQDNFCLARAVEPSARRRTSQKSVQISFYRDFYDEFRRLVGDYDRTDSTARLALVDRGFSDCTHADSDGWIPFEIDETIIAGEGYRISAIVLLFDVWETSTLPDYCWQLRYGLDGPSYSGRSVVDAICTLEEEMSQPAPKAFGDLNPRGDWYFRLAAADNPCLDLASIADIELSIEFAPVCKILMIGKTEGIPE